MKTQDLSQLQTRELRETADAIRRELMARDDATRREESRGTVGKCYRYRNCYSCPEKSSDYWWLYARVERIAGDGTPEGWSFQCDKDGVVTVAPLQRVHALYGGWVEITADVFDAEYAKVLTELRARNVRQMPRRRVRR